MIDHRIGLLILLITIQHAENVLKEQPPSNGLYRGVLHQEYQERLARDAHSNSEDILEHRENQERFKRDAHSNAEDFLERTSALGRISNGISLQNGLLNGSIPMDNVIVEFLNFGSTSVSDVAAFKSSRILSLTSQLKTMPTILNVTADVKAIEDQTMAWNEVHKDSKNIGDFKTLPGSDDYYKNATEFKKNVDLKSLSTVGDKLSPILEHLEKVEQLDPTASSDDVAISLNQIGTHIPAAANSLKNIGSSGLKSYSALENVQFFQPIEKFILLQKKRSGLHRMADQGQDTKIDALSAEVFKLMPASKDSQRDVSLLSDFVASRIDSQSTHRTFTIGFNGDVTEINKVSSDVRSSWFAQLFPGGLVDKLKDGLKPLVNSKRSLETVNTQLSPISSSDKLDSLQIVAGLQADIVALPSSSKPGYVSKELYSCFVKNSEAKDDWFTGINKATSSSKELAGKMVVLKVLESGDDDMLSVKDLDEFKTLLSTYSSDFTTETKDEIVRAATELKTSGKLKSFKDKVARLAQGLKEVSGTNFDELMTRVLDGKDQLKLFKERATTTNEFDVYTCLATNEKDLEEASKTIQVIQTLRSLKTSTVDDVETVASTVSNVSTSIPALRKIPSVMKKEENKESKELKNMTGHLMISKVLGESRTVLKNSMGLAAMETSVTGLDTSKQVATQEIANVTDPSTKQKIQMKWTSIDSDLATLKRGMVPIKSFLAASSLPTTLDGYGLRIKNLTTIPTMNINLTEKVEALDLLIPLVQDPAVKSELAKSKSSLEKLDALDLDFAKYKTSLGTAPTAFKDFDSFLRWFLIPPPVARLQKTPDGTASPAQVAEAEKKMMEAEKKKEEEGGGIPFWVWILIGGIVLVLIVAGVIVGVLLYKKKKEKEKQALSDQDQFEPLLFVSNLKFPSFLELYHFHFAAMIEANVMLKVNKDEEQKRSMEYLPERKHRAINKPMTTAKGVLWDLKKDGKPMPIHANIIPAGETTFIATQGPLEADETHDDTLEDFWHMIMLKESEFIAMLCNFEESGSDGPTIKKKKMRPKCGKYFHERNGGATTCGRYVVTTKMVSTKLDGVESEDVITRTLEVEDNKGEFKPRTVTHFHYITWPDGSIPKHSPHTLVNLVDKVSVSKKPVVVHCSQGIGRTMVFIGVKFVISDLLKHPNQNWSQFICAMRKYRLGAIQCLRQSMYLQVGVVLKLSQDYNLDMKHYNDQYAVMEKVHNQKNWPGEQREVDEDGDRKNKLENGLKFVWM